MKVEDIKTKVESIIEPVINSLGIELEDLELNRMKGRALLRVFIDKENGVTIDDCEQVSREIEAVLDVEDPIPFPFTLEVSSPGLDRVLKKPKDFRRYTGRKIRLVIIEPIDRQTFFVGEIKEACDSEIVLLLQGEKKVAVPYTNISRARLEVDV